MTDKKYTDKKIIKALQEMADYPHNYEEGQQLENALDLINRQKAEKEKLKAECEEQITLWKKHYESIFESAKETIKAEAYKEFAERLKSYLLLNKKGEVSVISFENIDNLLKEMVGEEE